MILFIIIVLILISIIGFISLVKSAQSLEATYEFAIEYRERFGQFSEMYFTRTHSQEAYIWLMMRANKMQADLSKNGKVDYLSPYQRIHVRQYDVLLNCLPKMRQRMALPSDVHNADDALLRHIGDMEMAINNIKQQLRNPLLWFADGVRFFFRLPIHMLNWFGIINENMAAKITSNLVFRLISGVVGFAGFVSSIVVTITGWEQTKEFFKTMWHH